MRRAGMFILLLLLLPAQAQDALNLPTELYVLLNNGSVERYSLGAEGVRRVTPDNEFVLDFAVAPDGNYMAYRTQAGLFTANMFVPNSVIQIEDARADVPNIRGKGETLAWSPKGDAIAYTTLYGARVYFNTGFFSDIAMPGLQNLSWSPDGRYLAAEAAQHVWWIYRREANEILLTSVIASGIGAVWIDRTRMVFAPAEGGLIIMDMAAGNQQTPLLDAFQKYRLPCFDERDGALRVFGGAANGDDDYGRLLRIDLQGTAVRPEETGIVDVPLTGLRWAPGCQLMIALEGGSLALMEPLSGQGFTLPIVEAAAYAWGSPYPPAADGMALPAAGYLLAPGLNGIVQVWHIARDGTLPATITPAENDITEYAIAPDGKHLVYVSDNTLWLYVVGSEADPQKITTLNTDTALNPVFSANGAYVFYYTQQPKGSGIWRYTLQNDDNQLFIPAAEGQSCRQPHPAPGVDAMFLVCTETGGSSVLLLADVNSGETQWIGRYEAAGWLSGSQLAVQGVLPGVNIAGLHIVDVNHLDVPPATLFTLTNKLRLLDFRQINPTTIRALVRQKDPGEISIVDIPLDGGTARIVGSAGFMLLPQLAPDGNAVAGYTHPGGSLIIYNLTTQERLMLAEPRRTSQFQWR